MCSQELWARNLVHPEGRDGNAVVAGYESSAGSVALRSRSDGSPEQPEKPQLAGITKGSQVASARAPMSSGSRAELALAKAGDARATAGARRVDQEGKGMQTQSTSTAIAAERTIPRTGAQIIVDALLAHGVDTVFGYMGMVRQWQEPRRNGGAASAPECDVTTSDRSYSSYGSHRSYLLRPSPALRLQFLRRMVEGN